MSRDHPFDLEPSNSMPREVALGIVKVGGHLSSNVFNRDLSEGDFDDPDLCAVNLQAVWTLAVTFVPLEHKRTLCEEVLAIQGKTLSPGGALAALPYIQPDSIRSWEQTFFANAHELSERLINAIVGIDLDARNNPSNPNAPVRPVLEDLSLEPASIMVLDCLKRASNACRSLSLENQGP